jgi:hypothetical protein
LPADGQEKGTGWRNGGGRQGRWEELENGQQRCRGGPVEGFEAGRAVDGWRWPEHELDDSWNENDGFGEENWQEGTEATKRRRMARRVASDHTPRTKRTKGEGVLEALGEAVALELAAGRWGSPLGLEGDACAYVSTTLNYGYGAGQLLEGSTESCGGIVCLQQADP